MIKFRVLGSLDLRGPEGEEILSVLSQPKRVALLSYLAVAAPRGFHRRDKIVGLFWPELDQDRARAALRKSLHHLRQSLGEDAILTRGDEEVSLDWGMLWCDAVEFGAAVEADPENALELYRGDLLEGFFLSDCPEFDRWLDGEREQLRVAAGEAAWEMAHRLLDAGRINDGEQAAQLALTLVPTDESEARRFIEALAAAGDRAAAVQFYERFAEGLEEELDLRPAAETRALVDDIRASRIAPAVDLTPAPAEDSAISLFDRVKAALADRYTLEREIGSGGMATVYLAEDPKHHRKVAVKVLRPELAQALGAERFLREIEVAANLTHPHILPVHDSGEADGILFYVMPYVEGESLRVRLTEETQLPVEDAVQIACEIADALAYAHERGVIHRDVKPANILLEANHAVLADFGVAQAVAEVDQTRITQTGMSIGTPAYMSPEQATGEKRLDGRSDLYALGCVLYEMLAGQPPFTGPSGEVVVRQHLTANPNPVTQFRPSVPEGVEQALRYALAKAPPDRYVTVSEFGRDLADHLRTPADEPTVVRRTGRGLGLGLGTIGAGAVALAAVFIWQPWVSHEDSETIARPRPWTILAEVGGSAPADLRAIVQNIIAGWIDGSGQVMTLGPEQVALGLDQAVMPESTPITANVARELAIRGGIETLFLPEIDRIGSGYVLRLRVVHAERDSVLAAEQIPVPGKDQIVMAASEIVGAVLDPVFADRTGATRRPPDPAITSSLEAYRKWTAGIEQYHQHRHVEAIALYKEAIEIDPDFAAAWNRMSLPLYYSVHPDSGRAAVKEALARRERLTERELLLAQYFENFLRPQSEGFLEELARRQERLLIAERTVREYPSRSTYNNLALSLFTLRRPHEAVRALKDFESRSPFGLTELQSGNLALWLRVAGEFEEARERAARLSHTRRTYHEMQISSSEAKWDEAEEKALELLRGSGASPQQSQWAHYNLAFAYAARGRIDAAINALREGSKLGPGDRAASVFLLTLSVVSGSMPEDFGLSPIPDDPREGSRELEGLWNLYRGDGVRAQRVAQTLVEPDPEDPGLVPGWDAGRLLFFARRDAEAGNWVSTLNYLSSQVRGEVWWEWPVYRQLVEWTAADALEKVGRPDSAVVHLVRLANSATESDFWWALQWRGLTHSFAHRRAALLFGQIGDREKAIEHWKAFLDAFTDPDPEFEWMVEKARVELAKLEGDP